MSTPTSTAVGGGVLEILPHLVDGQLRSVVGRADQRVALSALVLATAVRRDNPALAVDGPWLGVCGTHVYRATGEVHQGNPVYELVRVLDMPQGAE